jgi:hypothetical protein
MKKNLRKLVLSRETLHTLEAPAMGIARGGDVQPAINTVDLLPRSYLCQSRFCSGNCYATVACPVLTNGGCNPTISEPTFTF